MARKIEEEPIKESYLTRDRSGKILTYSGPSYRLDFPRGHDVTIEVFELEGLGYHALGFGYEEGQSSVAVHGDIPDWVIEGFEKEGIKVTQTKERGKEVPCPW